MQITVTVDVPDTDTRPMATVAGRLRQAADRIETLTSFEPGQLTDAQEVILATWEEVPPEPEPKPA